MPANVDLLTARDLYRAGPGAVEPAELVQDVSGLVSPPDVCMRIFELLQSPDTSAADIGEVIARDPNLAARLLRIVNSPFYGFARKIDTISRAIAIVGLRDLYSLVVAVSAVRSFSRLSSELVNMDTFWRHSLFTGLIARRLAKRCGVLHPERLFVAGLLHDVGSLVLYHRLPELAGELLLMAEGDEALLEAGERDTLGFSHAALGGLLLELWNLPPALVEAVAWHHHPEQAAEGQREAAIVHVGERLANSSEIGSFCEDPPPVVPTPELVEGRVWGTLGINPESIDPLGMIGDAGIEFTETAGVLIVG